VKAAAIFIVCAFAAVAALIAWERSKWVHERDAQCASASPLVTKRAMKQDVLIALGPATSEYGFADRSKIAKQFAPQQAADIQQRLNERDRLMVYSQSNSMMFVYLDQDDRAVHASCFLQ
jgi:hypothetical protein